MGISLLVSYTVGFIICFFFFVEESLHLRKKKKKKRDELKDLPIISEGKHFKLDGPSHYFWFCDYTNMFFFYLFTVSIYNLVSTTNYIFRPNPPRMLSDHRYIPRGVQSIAGEHHTLPASHKSLYVSRVVWIQLMGLSVGRGICTQTGLFDSHYLVLYWDGCRQTEIRKVSWVYTVLYTEKKQDQTTGIIFRVNTEHLARFTDIPYFFRVIHGQIPGVRNVVSHLRYTYGEIRCLKLLYIF
jgi:hypothetical protein